MSPLQKDADHAVVVAITSHAAFESGADDGDEVYREGVAFPLLQVRIKLIKLLICVEKIFYFKCMSGNIHFFVLIDRNRQYIDSTVVTIEHQDCPEILKTDQSAAL